MLRGTCHWDGGFIFIERWGFCSSKRAASSDCRGKCKRPRCVLCNDENHGGLDKGCPKGKSPISINDSWRTRTYMRRPGENTTKLNVVLSIYYRNEMSEDKVATKAVNVGSESDGDELRATQFLCNTPAFMNAAIRRQVLQEMFKMLPEKVQNRVRALKNIQLEQLKLESEFYEEVYKLERKYQARYQPIFDKRRKIICGELEPSKEEAVWKSESEEEIVADRMKEVSLKIKKNLKDKYPDDIKGIPDFWLTIFRSSELLSEMIQEHDEPVFKKLRDIKILYAENPMSYMLEFHFDHNEYFTNPVLTKQYFLKSTVDEDYPFTFEGPEIYKCVGCNIDWEKGMNLTIKTIRKKQKHKARGAVRTITKQVPNDSFFNFFNPPEVPDDKTKIDEESQSILTTDFEIGHFLRARIIPKAVLYYTGDIVDDDDDDDDYDEEEEEEDDEIGDDSDYDEEEGNTERQHQNKSKIKNDSSIVTPNECPNQ